MDEHDFLTAVEAAAALFVTPRRITQLCTDGLPGAVCRAGAWFVPAAWVRDEIVRRTLAADTIQMGRPTEITRRVRAAKRTKKMRSGDARHGGRRGRSGEESSQ